MIKIFLRRQYPYLIILGILLAIAAAVCTTMINNPDVIHARHING